MRVVLALIAVSVALGACAKPKAAVVTEPAVLQVPSPPPRVIVPPEPEPEPDPLAESTDKNEPKPRVRSTPPKVPASPKPEEAPPAIVEPPKQSPAPPPAVTLQPVLPASAKEVETKVHEQVQRAQGDLDKVDYKGLSADAKSQYDMAKRFLEQARQALVERNLVFAGKLAEKAGNIAAVLVGR